HLLEIALWALLFMICGEFSAFGNAFGHSAVSYTTLGNDNVIMSSSWRLLGPLAAANGALMFGVSTAMIFTVVQRLVQTRYVDLREGGARAGSSPRCGGRMELIATINDRGNAIRLAMSGARLARHRRRLAARRTTVQRRGPVRPAH